MSRAETVTAMAASTAKPCPDAPLIAACEEYIAASRSFRAGTISGDDSPAECRYLAAFDAVAATNTPSTLEGVLALARAAVTMARCPDGSLDFEATAGMWAGDVLVGLLRLHGEKV